MSDSTSGGPEARPGEPALDVAIVSFRCESLLRDCLGSLRDHPPATAMRVHVVDNASGDGTAEMVRAAFPDVELSVNPTNEGFGAANNLAIRAGRAPYVLVLNPDTRVTGGALDGLLALMESRPDVGMAGPRLVQPDGTLDHAGKRSFPTPVGALAHFTGVGRRAGAGDRLAQYRAPQLPDDVAGPVEAVNGAFMLIRRSALERVGLFDEGFWMYMEDLDLCYRFERDGWVTWYEPAATAIHHKAGTSGPARSARLDRAFHYGMYRFYRKHCAPERSLPMNLLVYAGIGLKLCVSLARNAARRAPGRSQPAL